MQPRQCSVRQIWKRDISRNVHQPKLIFVQKWWLISTGISSPGHLQNIKLCLNPVWCNKILIWEWKMSSSGKEDFIFGSGFFLWNVPGVLLSPKIQSQGIAELFLWFSHFLIPVFPQECRNYNTEPTHQFHTKFSTENSQTKAENTSGKKQHSRFLPFS